MKNLMALILILIVACSPKVTEPTVDDQVDKEVVIDPDDPCRTWNNLPNKDEVIEAHVLYRDFLKQEQYDEAYGYWKKAYEAAPMADGRRITHFEDGVALNYHFYKKSTTDEQKEQYKKVIMEELFPNMRACAENPGEAAGRQAFDLYYNYKDLASEAQIYDLFKLSIDEGGKETQAFVLNPFTKVLTDMYLRDEISTVEAQKYAALIKEAMEHGTANCKTDCEAWTVVNGYVPGQFDRLESVKDFFDCEYYLTKYYAEFVQDSQNCEVVDDAYLRMKWGGCQETDPRFMEVAQVKRNLCKEAPVGDANLIAARECLENGDYNCAINAYEKYVAGASDNEKKSKYTLRMAKIAYAHLKNYPKARKYALEAAGFRPNWGEPYMLIGNLYASSGPLCGPGRGWDSQVVTWPAIDKWLYAKKIDPSMASKANVLIGRYSQYMPSKGDIFQRGLSEGQSFRVGCWINETTTIRAAN